MKVIKGYWGVVLSGIYLMARPIELSKCDFLVLIENISYFL